MSSKVTTLPYAVLCVEKAITRPQNMITNWTIQEPDSDDPINLASARRYTNCSQMLEQRSIRMCSLIPLPVARLHVATWSSASTFPLLGILPL